MFTVKFIRLNQEEKSTSQTSIECPHFEIYERESGVVTVTTFDSFLCTNGVERHISPEQKDFDSCYVENSSGKTIESIRA